jgi:DNA-directed RNA polymerase subunit RPC12/RpoP
MEAVENVVRLAEFRRRKEQAQRATTTAEPGSQYFCLRCEAEEFRLYASGTIHCAKCGALIRNILVSVTSQTASE